MGNELFDKFDSEMRQKAMQQVQDYLKDIDASKLIVYTGSESERLRQRIEESLRAISASVYHCVNSSELLQRIQASPPSIVIIETVFTGVTGLEFVALLGVDHRTRMQPVIVITRLHSYIEFAPEDEDRCLGWDDNTIVDCYFQRKTLGFVSYCARKKREAEETHRKACKS